MNVEYIDLVLRILIVAVGDHKVVLKWRLKSRDSDYVGKRKEVVVTGRDGRKYVFKVVSASVEANREIFLEHAARHATTVVFAERTSGARSLCQLASCQHRPCSASNDPVSLCQHANQQ